MMNIGTHRTHCCVIHGCKYGNSDCPVENKTVLQDHLCESCAPFYGDKTYTMEDIKEVFEAPIGVTEPLTVLEKLHEIEKHKCIYNIHYCNAGVGISFYYSELDPKLHGRDDGEAWRKALRTESYHKDFEACIKAEYYILLDELNETPKTA